MVFSLQGAKVKRITQDTTVNATGMTTPPTTTTTATPSTQGVGGNPTLPKPPTDGSPTLTEPSEMAMAPHLDEEGLSVGCSISAVSVSKLTADNKPDDQVPTLNRTPDSERDSNFGSKEDFPGGSNTGSNTGSEVNLHLLGGSKQNLLGGSNASSKEDLLGGSNVSLKNVELEYTLQERGEGETEEEEKREEKREEQEEEEEEREEEEREKEEGEGEEKEEGEGEEKEEGEGEEKEEGEGEEKEEGEGEEKEKGEGEEEGGGRGGREGGGSRTIRGWNQCE